MKIKKQEFVLETENKFKKILDLLRHSQVKGFELSVKWWPRDDLSEPKTMAIQGERSIDGGWITSLPVGRNPDLLHYHEHFMQDLSIIEENVREYIVKNSLKAEWQKIEASIDEALKSGLSVDDLEYRSAAPILAITASSYNAHFCAPIMATAYATWCAEALAKNNLEHASYYAYRGLYWSSPTMFIANPNKRFVARAGTGGHGKDLRRDPVKDKVAELLVNLAPEVGWESTTAAITAVADELIYNHSIFVEDCLLQTETLPRTIRGWVKMDPERFRCRIKSKT